MFHRITVGTSLISITILMMMLIMTLMMMTVVDSKVIENPNSLQMQNFMVNSNTEDVASKRQLSLLTGIGKETSTPNFIRLVVMRFVYGLASTMGVEERLEDLFNGAFIPPNADGDLFGFGGFGGGGGDSDGGELFGDIAAFDGLFDDGAF